MKMFKWAFRKWMAVFPLSLTFIVFSALIVSNPCAIADETDSNELALAEIRCSADNGNAKAQLLLGLHYASNGDSEASPAKAAEWFRKAAEQDYSDAQYLLGTCFEHGTGVEHDPAQAFDWYHKAALQNQSDAQYKLSKCYADGNGTTKDPDKAIEWLIKAAENNHAEAKYILGMCHKNGAGVTKDTDKAIALLHQAADLGYPEAQFYLGLCYGIGDLVARNPKESVVWFKKAANQGHVHAQIGLGRSYASGDGVEKDPAIAANWFSKAAEQGNVEAQRLLGSLYYNGIGVEQSFSKAVEWSRKAAENGDAKAQCLLSACYDAGEGVREDPVQAAYWCRKAAEQGVPAAQSFLGQMYLNGRGVIQDDLQACVHFLIASALGYQDAYAYINIVRDDRLNHSDFIKAQNIANAWMESFTGAYNAAVTSGDEYIKTSNTGTGFLISSNGYFLTCAHVVEQGTSIKVRIRGDMFSAKLVCADKFNDIALLIIDGSDFKPIPLSSILPEIGDKVFTLGFPNPDFQGTTEKYTDGVVSSISGIMDDIRTMQITVPIQPGNSGGALLDKAGNVVGIVVAQLNAAEVFKYTDAIPQNVNFAVKINYALPLIQSVPNLVNYLPSPNCGAQAASHISAAKDSAGLVFTYR